METEQRTAPLITKNLWGIIRAILFMMKKDLSKKIPWFQLHMLLKRSTKIAGKAIGNLLLEHETLSSALTCRPANIRTTVIAPVEYEFSCSDTPHFYSKRKNNHRRYHSAGSGGGSSRRSHNDCELTVKHVKKVFDILNGYEAAAGGLVDQPEKSPLTMLGFGESPDVRRLRVTDSPFPEEETAEDAIQVNKAAEEFIRNFYKGLKQERKRAAVEPPSPVVYGRWGGVR
ncbi:hypothetical protein SSX86_021486 [Deinandra increscens subsp. villosa]|uniref:Uncharacterized protein n=1 Tax=Deinandra increscens subsp. villosa TaxID=3103831 RepID=A0AAP0GVW6_9ASTR